MTTKKKSIRCVYWWIEGKGKKHIQRQMAIEGDSIQETDTIFQQKTGVDLKSVWIRAHMNREGIIKVDKIGPPKPIN